MVEAPAAVLREMNSEVGTASGPVPRDGQLVAFSESFTTIGKDNVYLRVIAAAKGLIQTPRGISDDIPRMTIATGIEQIGTTPLHRSARASEHLH